MTESSEASSGVVLETPRLRLRPHRTDDLQRMIDLAGKWEVACWLRNLPHPFSEDDGRGWILHVQRMHAAGRPRAFAIAQKDTDELIGGIGLGNPAAEEPVLGYWLGQPYWNLGYGREAVAAVVDYGFHTLEAASIAAFTDPDNVASQRVLLACGLNAVGEIDLAEPLRRGASRVPLFRIMKKRPDGGSF
jgi:[ribosomal protein S5]-alanine N-acetyltransferase